MPEHMFELKPSKSGIFFIVLVFFLTSLIVCSLPLESLFCLSGLMVVIGYGSLVLLKHGFILGNGAILAIQYQEDGSWALCISGNRRIPVSLRGDSIMTPWVSLLRFQQEEKARSFSCLVWQGSMKPADYRFLSLVSRQSAVGKP